MVYIVRCRNSVVTDFYLDVIGKMFSNVGEDFADYNENILFNKDHIIVVATVVDFLKIYVKGYRKIVLWMQGIESEESFLKHQSKMRKFILDKLTYIALKNASGIFFVSEKMREFEEEKFNIDTTRKSFIMPCFNTEFDSNVVMTPQKYENNIFTYVGSLSKWQCFEETVEYYKIIEEKLPNCKLLVFTPEKEKAQEILDNKGIINYTVDFVSSQELTKKLSLVKFGFVLRENIPVNQVATPTKLSSYLSAGVIPIFSDCICDFKQKTKKMKYVIPVSNKEIIPEKLMKLCYENINIELLKKEYSELFATYYNPQYYIENSKKWIRDMLNNWRI